MTQNIMAAIEAILFASGEPVPLKTIAFVFEIDVKSAREYVLALIDRYERQKSGLKIIIMNDTYQLTTSPDMFEYIQKALSVPSSTSLSKAALETLAIIAYRQPVTRGEIDQIRGVQSSSSLSLLIAKGIVRDAGKLDLPGRPIAYETTNEFLKLMRIENLGMLPAYGEFSTGIASALESETDSPT